jgi:hypothetical protein
MLDAHWVVGACSYDAATPLLLPADDVAAMVASQHEASMIANQTTCQPDNQAINSSHN